MTDERPTHLDLFSGIGGFALAAQWAGFRTIGFCEIDKYFQKMLAKNFPDTETCEDRRIQQSELSSDARASCPIFGNIFTLNGRDFSGVDLITGGFPCQPFSVAGKRRGAADDRAIWPEMFRVISEARPTWVLGENVPGIIPMELDNVLSDLEGIGYATRAFVIPACAVDARHRRDRLWVVGRFMGDSERDMAYASVEGLEGRQETIRPKEGWNGDTGYDWTSSCSERGNCEWLPEPDVCGMVDGLSQRLDETLNGQRLDSKVRAFTNENVLRNMWTLVAAKPSSYRQQSVKQLASEFADALCKVSHQTSLEEREDAVEIAFAYLCGLCKACETLGLVRDSQDSLLEIWRSMSSSEADWSHMAACKGCFHSEWPDVPRVSHGIKERVNRLKGLGNAIVPQVAYEILREIRKLC